MKLNFVLPPDGFKRLFYDIETSYLVSSVWRIGQNVNINHGDIILPAAVICICWKWEGQKEVHSVEWNEGCDKVALSRFMQEALKADELIGHNGDNFDEKWVRTRCLIHGIDCPPKFNSLDTLKKARTHFKFASNRLDYLGNFLFGEGKSPMSKQDWDDIVHPLLPKALGFDVELPKKYYEAMNKMVKYCKKDVELLEDVFHKLQPYVNHNTHVGAATGYGRFSCPKCASDNVAHQRKRMTKTGMLRHQLKCKNCSSHFTVSNKVWEDKLADDWKKKQS